MEAYASRFPMGATTVKVSRSTLQELERLKRRLKTKTLDQTIEQLLRERRAGLLRALFGADKQKPRPFTGLDRLEDRPL